MAEGVQASAADCARALSRSAKGLRMRMAEAPVAAPLVALLRSATHPNVQAAAASALCNLVLDFSPVKVRLQWVLQSKAWETSGKPEVQVRDSHLPWVRQHRAPGTQVLRTRSLSPLYTILFRTPSCKRAGLSRWWQQARRWSPSCAATACGRCRTWRTRRRCPSSTPSWRRCRCLPRPCCCRIQSQMCRCEPVANIAVACLQACTSVSTFRACTKRLNVNAAGLICA